MAVATLVKTIGTSSRQYSTLQAWEDAAPADLTTAEQWSAGTFTGTFTAGETVTGIGLTAGKFLASDGSSYVAFGIVTGNSATLVTLTGSTSGATCVVSTKTHTGIIWRGEAYNDSEFTAAVNVSGSTMSASCYAELTVAAGQSFIDQAGVRSNALYYNQSLGVGQKVGTGFLVQIPQYAKFSRFQCQKTSGSGGVCGSLGTVKDCLLTATTSIAIFNSTGAVGGLWINCLGVQTNTAGNGTGVSSSTPTTFIGCGLIRTSNRTAAGTGWSATASAGGGHIMQSCYSFGYSTCASASNWDTTNSKYNATEQSSGLPGTNNQHSVTYNATTPFAQADGTGTLDLRSIASTTLAANGFLDATNAPLDISGYTRTATPTIGPWEIAASGVPRQAMYYARRRMH
eukprot:GHVR01183027.1.p1 GENE.GHVR01183027.1~~GHVR01183027.1.p1  ORF type:complete len:400 (+),score=48.82 GHVR01183027.1:705-1904(+)